jgi:3-dehydroquinate synthase
MPDGEEHKNLAWLAFVYDKLIDAEIDRGGAVIALGGGVVGDLAGFGAASYLRGIDCVQIPTTLVAQVDSSIGGKTGINHAAGKNLIGAFSQPRFVLADVECLRRLPRREFTAGLAEVIKYGAILDPELFALLENQRSAILRLDRELLIRIVKTSCTLKALVVAEDETEGDYRAVLNFGHTIGHAIESLTEYREFLHGEAVAMGMVAAARVSHRLGFCSEADSARIRALVEHYGLPTEIPSDIGPDSLALAMRTDKKARGGTIKFVCIEAIGRTRFERLTCEEIVRHARG